MMVDRFIARRLSGKLLLMTITFIMLAEIVIFIPSAAVFRQDWLEDRAQRAGHLTLALTGVPDYEGSEILSRQFMQDTDVSMLATKREGMTELILGMPPTSGSIETIDLRTPRRLPNLIDTFRTFFGSDEGHLRIISSPLMEGQEQLEFIAPKAALKQALIDYSQRILLLSLAIAIITGALLYFALSMVLVRPIKQLAKDLSAFREDPERRRSNRPPSSRLDEIGQLQRELYDMKQSVRAALKQQDRLAALGLAVAKINHDLRNILTSAQLVSDRIAMDKDERVAHMGERLVRAVDRGIKLCADVLNFSQSREEPPKLKPIRIALLIGEAAGDTLSSFGRGAKAVQFINQVPSELTIDADADHTYRIFQNLFRNAGQALEGVSSDDALRQIRVTARTQDGAPHIDVTDTGTGLPARAQENLFTAFTGGSGHGSTGLGLTISRELAQAQGGDLELVSTGPDGTVFSVSFSAPNS